MVILMWPLPFWTLINYLLNNKPFLLITTPVLLPYYHVPEEAWISTAAFGVMVAFWQAGCHLWICQWQETLRCFASAIQNNRTRVPAPCCQEALPSSSHSAKLLFHGSLSRVDQGGKTAARLLEKTAGNLWSKLILPYAPRSWKTACTKSWVFPLDTFSREWN